MPALAKANCAPESPPRPTSSAGTPPTILVVDDDEDIRDALGECLRAEGYQVRSAMDGRKALDALHGGLEPDVIILDLRMPILSGYDVFAALRSSPRWRSIPVVILTADHEHDAHRLAGAFAILRKPASLDALLEAAEAARRAEI